MLRWELMPHFIKDLKACKRLINARLRRPPRPACSAARWPHGGIWCRRMPSMSGRRWLRESSLTGSPEPIAGAGMSAPDPVPSSAANPIHTCEQQRQKMNAYDAGARDGAGWLVAGDGG